jgi:hypothetical protein
VKGNRNICRGVVNGGNCRFEFRGLLVKPLTGYPKALGVITNAAVLNKTSPPEISRTLMRHSGHGLRQEQKRFPVIEGPRRETFQQTGQVRDALFCVCGRTGIFVFALHRGANRRNCRNIAVGVEIAGANRMREFIRPWRHAKAFDDLSWSVAVECSSERGTDDEQ